MKEYTIQLESRAARDCFKIAEFSLELAERATESWEIDHHVTTGITFTAFSIEAMLNHFGGIYYEDWNVIKGGRKDIHKKLFKAVNLPNYMGCSTYQIATSCFVMRDNLAHGKTIQETISLELPSEISSDNTATEIISIKSASFRDLNIDILKKFINVAKNIERDIEENGFYPQPEGTPENKKSKLQECPLSTSGVRVW